MTVLEIDLGQSNTYSNGINGTQVNRAVGIISDNNANLNLPTSIHLINRPQNTIFFINKIGNFKNYTLVLTFEAI